MRHSPMHRTSMRTKITGILGVAALLLAVFTRSTWLSGGWLEHGLAWAGLLLVTGGIFGRLWSTVYVGGRKTKALVREGPFALTRNPLYFFSLMATVGLGLASANAAVFLLLVGGFALYYPGVLAHEEERLARKHGEAFSAYQAEVPRFWPRWRRDWPESDWTETSGHKFRQALGDAFGFIAAYLVLRIIATAHAQGWLSAWPFL